MLIELAPLTAARAQIARWPWGIAVHALRVAAEGSHHFLGFLLVNSCTTDDRFDLFLVLYHEDLVFGAAASVL